MKTKILFRSYRYMVLFILSFLLRPYVQGNKNLACRSSVSTFSTPKTSGDTAQVYQSFFDGNPVYVTTRARMREEMTVEKHGLEGDTVVDGQLYHKMSVVYDGWEDSVQFWVRESVTHDKVWVRMPWDSTGLEVLVVDLNLKERDSFQMYGYGEWDRDSFSYVPCHYIVDKVYYQEHPGGRLKHVRLKPLGYKGYTERLSILSSETCAWRSRHLEFIEGVGSNLGFVYGRIGMVLGSDDPLWGILYPYRPISSLYDYIICMEKDSAVYYEHPNMECVDCDAEYFDEFWSELDIGGPISNESVHSMSRYLRLSPNPAREEVSLRWTAESPVGGACRIELYTMQGVKLCTFSTDSWPYTLPVADLPVGTYVLRVAPKDASATWQATVRLTRL